MSKYTETVNNSKAITDNYTVKKEKIRGITVWMYIPKENKEKDMKETNLEHYKEDLKKIATFYYDNPRGTIKKIEERFCFQVKLKRGERPTDAILEWMSQPYKEPILDEAEREYLSAVIKPFKSDVAYIKKSRFFSEPLQFIYISLKDEWTIKLNLFEAGSQYKGMEEHKKYTVEELGL